MDYKILESNGVEIENIDGAAFNDFSAGGQSGIVAGVLNECQITSTGNVITVGTGLLLIKGIRIKITSPADFSLSGTPSAPMKYYLVARVVLSSDRQVYFDLSYQLSSAVIKDSLYSREQGQYEIDLCSFVHNTEGSIDNIIRTASVISANDIRNIEERFSRLSEEIEYGFDQKSIEVNSGLVRIENKVDTLTSSLVELGIINKLESSSDQRFEQTGGNSLSSFTVLDDSYTTIKKIEGNSMSSVNLVDISRMVKDSGGTAYSDGLSGPIGGFYKLSKNGESRASKVFPCLIAAGTYYWSFRPGNSSSEIASIGIKHYLKDGTERDVQLVVSDRKATIYLPMDCVGVQLYLPAELADNVYIYLCNLMLCKNKDTPYQPFFAGVVSSKLKGIKSTGKNLFDPNIFLKAGFTESNGIYSGNSDLLYSNYNVALGGVFGRLNLQGKQVSMSYQARNVDLEDKTLIAVFEYTDGTASSESIGYVSSTSWNTFSATSNPNKTVYSIYFNYALGGNVELRDFCVKIGTDATYEPYEESNLDFDSEIELGKWDFIENGKLTQQTVIEQLTGEESWTTSSNEHGTYFTHTLVPNAKKDYLGNVNNKFPNRLVESGVPCSYMVGGSLIVFPNSDKNNEEITTVEQWKDFLRKQVSDGNPFTVAYKSESATVSYLDKVLEYKVWDKGSERKILENNSVVPTVTNDYYVYLGGEK